MFLYRFIVICGIILGLLHCKPATEPTSLSDDQLATIMSELLIGEGATVMINGYKRDSIAAEYFKEVFALQKTTLEEYERNLRIVANDQARLDSIMAQAERLLKARQTPAAPPAQ